MFYFCLGFVFFFLKEWKVYEKHRAGVSVLETHGLFQLILHDSCTCFCYSIPIWGVVRNRFLDLCFWTFLVWNIFNLSEPFFFLWFAMYSEGNELGWSPLRLKFSQEISVFYPKLVAWQKCYMIHVLCVGLECSQWCGCQVWFLKILMEGWSYL